MPAAAMNWNVVEATNCRAPAFQPAFHPPEHLLVPVLAVQGLEHPMALVRKHDHLRRHALTPERGVHL